MSTPPLALVTGASSGIGAATALALGREGWKVVLVARGRARLGECAEAIRAEGGVAIEEPVDASDGRAARGLADRVTATFGVPDVIVHAAGAGVWRFVEETSPDEAERMMAAPHFAAFHVTSAFMPGLLARGSGLLVHVNSPAARIPWPGATGYTAARWALPAVEEVPRAPSTTPASGPPRRSSPARSGSWSGSPGDDGVEFLEPDPTTSGQGRVPAGERNLPEG